MGRAQGVPETQLLALDDFEPATHFSEAEKAALAYAQAITADGSVSQELFARVTRSFNPNQIVALTAAITWEICAAKFNRALEIEAQGVCYISPSPE